MKARLIVNPVSGNDASTEYLETVNKLLRTKYDSLDIIITTSQGDAILAGERTARDDYELVFVGGGDGTLNEVLNGVARVDGALQRLTFGLLPFGTGNDFAEALGIPTDIEQAINILFEEQTVDVDVGILNERYFINVSAGGFIAEVSDAVSPQLKTIAGKLAYLIGGAQVLFDYEPVRMLLRAISPGSTNISYELDMQLFAVCNSRMIGGGRLIAPHAIINDGLFDVCVIETMPTLEFVGLLTRVSNGEHLTDERVKYFQAQSLNVQFSRKIKVNTDGEVLEVEACQYKLIKKAARFLAGKAPYAGK
jgi:diacylglycerol kinase (ATP)